jgi:hypothetical protein
MEAYSQLLCTFSTLENYSKDIDSIAQSYKIFNNSVFVLQNVEDRAEVFLTYNVEKQSNLRHFKTISVHRKKDYNVIYSINALNKLIASEAGEAGANRQVDWTKYKNSIIISCEEELKIIHTKLLTIYRLK